MAGTISKRKGHPIHLATWPIEFQNICQYQLMCKTLKPRNQWIVILRVITSHSQPIFIGQLYPGYRLVLHRICPRPGPNIPTPSRQHPAGPASFRNGVASASDASISSLL